jgi:PKD repeat protein
LREDPTLWVDARGHLLVRDTGLLEPQGSDLNTPDGGPSPDVPRRAASAAQVASAFVLHSRPGSDRVIHLDFDGHRVVGTGWNDEENGADFTVEPYDVDGSPASFSAGELETIREVWARVSEDYAVFDVDVTTEDPGAEAIDRSGEADTTFGTRAVITGTAKVYSSCHCGGMAYVDVFDRPSGHARFQPAFVFQRGVGGRAKEVAEAVSHEVGHTLGLHHDRSASTEYFRGHGAWAPIMGAGYERPISQWSAGEYSGATNTEDDLAVIAAGGLNVLADDHGGTAGTATVLDGPTVSVRGIITTRTDVDRFVLSTTGGALSLEVRPAAEGPNLDASLSLYDGSGTLLARDDPVSALIDERSATGLGASLRRTVAAGTYTVAVDGVGAGSPGSDGYSDYASIGRYTLSGTLPQAAPYNQPPVAVASASVVSGPAPLSVTFDSSGSHDPDGRIVSRRWSWGDGTADSTADGVHRYTRTGTRTATLEVTDDLGRASTATVRIAVATPRAPAAPTQVRASVAWGKVTVRWTDRATDEIAYQVVRRRRYPNGTWSQNVLVSTRGAGATSATNSPWSKGTYLFLVRARGRYGASAWVWSNTVRR